MNLLKLSLIGIVFFGGGCSKPSAPMKTPHKPYPSWTLFLTVFSTRIIGTLLAVYGIFMEAIGWEYAVYIWIYATFWFFLNDFIKIITYKIIRKNGNGI